MIHISFLGHEEWTKAFSLLEGGEEEIDPGFPWSYLLSGTYDCHPGEPSNGEALPHTEVASDLVKNLAHIIFLSFINVVFGVNVWYSGLGVIHLTS